MMQSINSFSRSMDHNFYQIIIIEVNKGMDLSGVNVKILPQPPTICYCGKTSGTSYVTVRCIVPPYKSVEIMKVLKNILYLVFNHVVVPLEVI